MQGLSCMNHDIFPRPSPGGSYTHLLISFSFFPFFTDIVLDNLVSSNQLEEENREKVREALLIKHRHQDVKEHDFLKHIRGIKRANSHPKKMNSMDDPEAEMTLQPPGQMSGM